MFENNSSVWQRPQRCLKNCQLWTMKVPQVYTIVDNNLKTCFNSMPSVPDGTTIPIGLLHQWMAITAWRLLVLKVSVHWQVCQSKTWNWTIPRTCCRTRYTISQLPETKMQVASCCILPEQLVIGEKTNNSSINSTPTEDGFHPHALPGSTMHRLQSATCWTGNFNRETELSDDEPGPC